MQDKLIGNFNISPNFSEIGVYVHVPFCPRMCEYCRFYKKRPTLSDIELYLEAVEIEISDFFTQNPDYIVSTVFFGGGTPTSLSEKHLSRITALLSKKLKENAEWTVEVSPSTISDSKLSAMKDFGVNRISMGVQSFSEKTLANLGRQHSKKSAYDAIEKISNHFKNFSIDLIFGEKNQTLDEWNEDLLEAVQCPVSHISGYCLEFESGLSSCMGKGKDDMTREREADFMEHAMNVLPSKGFLQYEVSNYAKCGHECIHNVNTWKMKEWIGFGPAAASQVKGLRRRNPYDLELWADSVKNRKNVYEDLVELDDDELYSSALIFGLRMREGVDLDELKKRFPNADEKKYSQNIQNLVEENLLIKKDSRIMLSPESVLMADAIASYLL